MPDWMGAVLGSLRLTLSLGLALMGRPSIIAKGSTACDLTFIKSVTGLRAPQWAIRIQVVPRRLEFRNADGQRYRFTGHLDRRGKGGLDLSQEWNEGEKYLSRTGDSIVLWYDRFPEDWVSDQASDWAIELWAEMSGSRKRLYRGTPTTIRLDLTQA